MTSWVAKSKLRSNSFQKDGYVRATPAEAHATKSVRSKCGRLTRKIFWIDFAIIKEFLESR